MLTKGYIDTTSFAGSGYHFYDLTTKANYKISEKDQKINASKKSLNQPILSIDGYHTGNGGISGGTTETGFTMNDYKTKHKIGNAA